jgi:hypothetical protein
MGPACHAFLLYAADDLQLFLGAFTTSVLNVFGGTLHMVLAASRKHSSRILRFAMDSKLNWTGVYSFSIIFFSPQSTMMHWLVEHLESPYIDYS